MTTMTNLAALTATSTLAPARYLVNTNGAAVNLQDSRSATIVVSVGALDAGTYWVVIEDSDDGVTFQMSPQGLAIGGFATLQAGTVQSVGYMGGKKFLRLRLLNTGATVGAYVSASVLTGYRIKA